LVRARPFLSHALAAVHIFHREVAAAEGVLNDCSFEPRDESSETRNVQGKLLVARGWIAREQGDREKAIGLLRHALEFLAPQCLNARSAALLNLGVLYDDMGDPDLSAAAFMEAVDEAKASDSPNLLLRASYGLGKLREAQGALEEAARLYHAALAYAQ